LFDVPEGRKQHDRPIPPLGGIALFTGFVIASILLVDYQVFGQIKYLLAASLLLVLIGIKDDLVGITAGKKFYFQIGIVSLLYYAGFRVENFYGLLPFEEMPVVLSFLFTQLFLLTLINAYNLIDGINGLAGSLSLFAAISFTMLFAINGQMNWAIMSASLAGAIAAFLRYNFHQASIFMGDTGSTFLGVVIGIFCLEFLNQPTVAFSIPLSLSLVIGIIFIPVIDLVRVFATRIIDGKSPFSADRRHIHHIFMRQGSSARRTCLILVCFNVLLIFSISMLPDIHSLWNLAIYIVLLNGLMFAIKHLYSLLNTPIPYISTQP